MAFLFRELDRSYGKNKYKVQFDKTIEFAYAGVPGGPHPAPVGRAPAGKWWDTHKNDWVPRPEGEPKSTTTHHRRAQDVHRPRPRSSSSASASVPATPEQLAALLAAVTEPSQVRVQERGVADCSNL